MTDTGDTESVAPEMETAPPARTAADGYAFAAVVCAASGLLLPIGLTLIGGTKALPTFVLVLISAPTALMLARATEEPIAREPVSPGVARVAGVAQMLSYASIALVVTFCAALLLGILGRVITS
jgi:hypothetical protein